MVFGTYVETLDNPNITNNLNSTTHKFIVLGSTGKLQGIQRVFCLNLLRILKKRRTIYMIAPYQLIKKVNDLYKKQK